MSRHTRHRRSRSLAPGTIFEVARAAGMDFPAGRDKVPIRCPFHDDTHPSAVLFESNYFFCSACGLILGFKAFAERLGQNEPNNIDSASTEFAARRATKPSRKRQIPPFTPADASHLWSLARERVARESPHPDDAGVYAYLAARRLAAAIGTGCVGILPTCGNLTPMARCWVVSCHRIIAPLFDLRGDLVSVQSRSFLGIGIKTLFPDNAQIKRTVFANQAGLDLLRGRSVSDDRVVYGEGLTDSLAYAIACPYPAICAPGTPTYVDGIGPWVKGKHVTLAVDCDPAGDAVLDDAIAAAHRFGALHVTRLRWPKPAKDACDVLQDHGEIGLRRLLERAPGGSS